MEDFQQVQQQTPTGVHIDQLVTCIYCVIHSLTPLYTHFVHTV